MQGGDVTTRLFASCSTHAAPPLFCFSSLFPLSLTRLPCAGLVSLSLTRVRLAVAAPPHVYNLFCFDERALSSFSCGIRRFSLSPCVSPLQRHLRTLSSRLARTSPVFEPR